MSMAFQEALLEKRLHSLANTQESIQSMSAYCLQGKGKAKQVIDVWLKVVKKERVSQRRNLFYLANDVIQLAKRKNIKEFVEGWKEALKMATPFVREEKVRNNIARIFKIWAERHIYDKDFLAVLFAILNDAKPEKISHSHSHELGKKVKDQDQDQDKEKEMQKPILESFEPENLISKIASTHAAHKVSGEKHRKMKSMCFNMAEVEKFHLNIKERKQGDEQIDRFNEGVMAMEEYVGTLKKELTEKEELLALLDQASLFYESQRGEAKVVANAYRNFGGKIKAQEKKLEEVMTSLPEGSPVPSPDVNAPSPGPEDDFDLEDDKSSSSNLPLPPPSSLKTSDSIPSFFGTSFKAFLQNAGNSKKVSSFMDAPPNLDEIPLPPPTPSNFGEEIKRSIMDSTYIPTPPIQQQHHTLVQIKNGERKTRGSGGEGGGLAGISELFNRIGATLNISSASQNPQRTIPPPPPPPTIPTFNQPIFTTSTLIGNGGKETPTMETPEHRGGGDADLRLVPPPPPPSWSSGLPHNFPTWPKESTNYDPCYPTGGSWEPGDEVGPEKDDDDDTPLSPPHHERGDTYSDVDYRIPFYEQKKDTDYRNLISLTGGDGDTDLRMSAMEPEPMDLEADSEADDPLSKVLAERMGVDPGPPPVYPPIDRFLVPLDEDDGDGDEEYLKEKVLTSPALHRSIPVPATNGLQPQPPPFDVGYDPSGRRGPFESLGPSRGRGYQGRPGPMWSGGGPRGPWRGPGFRGRPYRRPYNPRFRYR